MILVELHPMYIESIEETITGRFVGTHDIAVMRLGERSIEHIPSDLRSRVTEDDGLWAVNEEHFRGTGTWLLLSPR